MDAFVVTSNRRLFGSMVILIHIWHFGADDYLVQFADYWLHFEEKDQCDQLLRMPHFGDGSLLDHFFQLLVISIFAHLGMASVLVDSCQFIGKRVFRCSTIVSFPFINKISIESKRVLLRGQLSE